MLRHPRRRTSPKYSFFCRHHGCSGHHVGAAHRVRRNHHITAANWFSRSKRTALGPCDCAAHTRVFIANVVDRRVPDVHVCRAVVVIDHRNVHISRVGDVHVPRISRTHAIRRKIGIAIAQREPSHAAADSNRHSKARSPNPRNQRRSIHRTNSYRSWNPSPAIADAYPAAIVERSESPRRIIHPGPSPRLDPGPVTFAIRSPSRVHARIPNRAIGRRRFPVAVIIKILVTNRSRRDIARRSGRLLAPLAHVAPVVKSIGPRHAPGRVGQRLLPAEAVLLTAAHAHSIAFSGSLTVTTPHRDPALIFTRHHVKAIIARLHHRVRKVRRIHFDNLARVQISHRKIQRTLVQFNLRRVVIQIGERHACFASQSQCSRSHR